MMGMTRKDKLLREIMTELGRAGGKARMAKMSVEERRRVALLGVAARKRKAAERSTISTKVLP